MSNSVSGSRVSRPHYRYKTLPGCTNEDELTGRIHCWGASQTRQTSCLYANFTQVGNHLTYYTVRFLIGGHHYLIPEGNARAASYSYWRIIPRKGLNTQEKVEWRAGGRNGRVRAENLWWATEMRGSIHLHYRRKEKSLCARKFPSCYGESLAFRKLGKGTKEGKIHDPATPRYWLGEKISLPKSHSHPRGTQFKRKFHKPEWVKVDLTRGGRITRSRVGPIWAHTVLTPP